MLFNNTNMRTAMAYTNAVGDKVYPIIVDIKKGIKSTEEVSFVSSDINTGILSVAFIQGNDTYNVEGAEVICSIMRPDTTTLEIPCNIINGNTIEVPLGVNGTSQDGVYSFDFKVFKGGNKIVGTPIMNYSVSLSISNDLVVEEDDRLPVLTMLITQVNELKEETRETINQANVATVASREATASAIEATNNANAVSERVSQETNEAISRVDNTIVRLNNTVSEKISEIEVAKSDMTNTVSNKVNEVESRFNALTSSQQQDAEVIDARDGETSLKSRLDRDIEKAKQVYVNVEGSHISTDSSSGYAKDVEILGNTIQDASNLADIRSVGDTVEGQELYEIPVLSVGKNLFDGEFKDFRVPAIPSFGDTNISKELGKVTFNSTAGSFSFKCYLKQGAEYLLSFDVSNKTPNYMTTIGSSRVDYTTSKTKERITHRFISQGEDVIIVGVYGTMDKPSTLSNFQIEEGTVATPYEPYVEDKLTILSPVQLEKVGDVRDRIICKDGVWGVEKNVITKRVDATKLYTYKGNTELNKIYGYDNFADDYAKPTIQVSNKFLYDNSIYANGNEGIFINSSGGIRFGILSIKEYGSALDKCKKWVEDNDLFVSYATTKPTFIPLPHDQQVKLRTFANKTNISFLTEIEGTIKAQVPKSIGATVNTHTEQIRSLNNELNRVKKLEESTVSTVTTESDFTTVEATSNGYFEDVKLEGKTLVNLCGGNFSKGGSSVSSYIINTTENMEISITTRGSAVLYKEAILKPNTMYTIIADVKISATPRFSVYSKTSNSYNTCGVDVVNKSTNEYAQYVTKITTQGEEYTRIVIGFHGGLDVGCVLGVKNLIVLEGDHTQNLPSYFEGLKSVGQSATTSEDGVDEIVVSSVKGDGNLFDEKWEIGKVLGSDGMIIDGVEYATSSFVPVYNCSNIYITSNYDTEFIYLYDSNKTFISRSNVSKSNYNFAIPSNCKYVRFRVIDKVTNKFTNEMIEYFSVTKGTTPKPYTPHQSDKKRLLYYNEETQRWEKPILREWDSIEKHANGKYYYHQRSGEVVLNGSESRTSAVEQNTTIRYQFPLNNIKLSSNLLCDKFKQIPGGMDSEGVSNHATDNMLQLTLNKDKGNVKTWLQANNVTVVYQLAQEKVYECTNIDLITYANETNYVVNSGAIVPRTTLKVHNNISNVVRILQEKVSLLENKFIEGLKKVLAGDMYSLAELLYPEDFVEENPENDIMLLPFE